METDFTREKTDEQLKSLISMYSQSLRALAAEQKALQQELAELNGVVENNEARLKLYRAPPYLVASVVEMLHSTKQPKVRPVSRSFFSTKDEEEVSPRENRIGIVIKTSTRQTVFLPVLGLIDPERLRPGDLLGVNKDTFVATVHLPTEFDLRAKNMLVEASALQELEDFSDAGSLAQQIEELSEAVVLPLTHPDRFRRLGVVPGKGALLYGPPGTGKTLLARAVAKHLGAAFIRVNAPQLSQSYVGAGAALVREIFQLAREKRPTVVFIDEIDAIGGKRVSDGQSKEVMRTLLELLNQLDGFRQDENIKVIGATNRADIMDPALLRSGRLDRKIEFQLPDRQGRAEILRIHSRKMRVCEEGTNKLEVEEIAQTCQGFNGAQLRAVCVEAGMSALRKDLMVIGQNEFIDGVWVVRDKKKKDLNYFV